LVVGECMPIPDLGLIGSILGSIEGYMTTKDSAVAVFRSKFEGGKVQVQKNMRNAFKEGETVLVIVMTQRQSKPVHPAMTVEELRGMTKAVIEHSKVPKKVKDKLEFILGFLDEIIKGKDLGQIRGFETLRKK